ncbi:MAG TPA: YibE/F family protein [Actinomycetota bacterium]|nr:YibE/F family protein [Actinomycetota bacterium]
MHHHAHGHSSGHREEIPARTRRLLTLVTVPLVLLTLLGFLLLWPRTKPELSQAIELPTDLYNGTVTAINAVPCPGLEDEGLDCSVAEVRLTQGPNEGDIVAFEVADPNAVRTVREGSRIVVARTQTAPGVYAYDFADVQRAAPMAVLALIFAAVVIALGRLRGIAALVGIGVSLGILVQFVLPAILAGRNPLAVAIVGSAGVMFISLYLAHGVNVRTTSAVLGTLASLTITALLALAFVQLTQLTGFASEESTYIRVASENINLRGILLGGIIIGSLGVLDDVTVTQASAVWELHLANPALKAIELYRAAIRIGRDHIASTVNTLVLAYAGAALPLLILFTISEARLGDVLTGEVIAEEVVRTLVGSIGLVASVPITTGLAALVVTAPGDPGPPAKARLRKADRFRKEPTDPVSEQDSFWDER